MGDTHGRNNIPKMPCFVLLTLLVCIRAPLENRQLLKVDYGSQMGVGRPNKKKTGTGGGNFGLSKTFLIMTMLTQLTKLRRTCFILVSDVDS